MNSRERFLKACRCEKVDRPPLWLMRQAGRYLPEYQKIRRDNSFHDVVENPELAAEVTLQPIRRFDFDAAIIFSDILVIPEAMGQTYHFPEGGGIAMDFAVSSKDDLDKLSVPSDTEQSLGHVGRAIERVSEDVGHEKAIIGFGGAPWTLAAYMVEGGSSKKHLKIREFYYEKPDLFEALMHRIVDSLVEYFTLQIKAGADVIQIFDSWGGILSADTYSGASVRWIRRVIQGVEKNTRRDVPYIVFAKGMHHHLDLLASTGADVLSIDWTASLPRIYEQLPEGVAVQGNLDPAILNTTPEIVREHAGQLLEEMEDKPGFVFNLGHGITPRADIKNVEALTEVVFNRESRS